MPGLMIFHRLEADEGRQVTINLGFAEGHLLVKDKLRIKQIQRILLLIRAIVHQIANRRLRRIIKMQARFPALFHPGLENRRKIGIQRLQYRHPHFLQGCGIAELFVLSPDRDDQQFLAQVKGLGGSFETCTGENGLTGDKTLVKGAFADGKEKDIPIAERAVLPPWRRPGSENPVKAEDIDVPWRRYRRKDRR